MQINISKQARFLVYVLTAQAVAGITLVLDIPFARQVSGFLFLTFIPGLILLRILKLERSNITETILFSAGLSIAFLMFIGFLINELGSSNFISEPLSTEPLAIIINIIIVLMCILAYLTNKEDFNIMDSKSLRIFPLVLPYLALPLLGVIGVMLVSAFKNNLLLLLIIIIISILFLLSPFSPKFSSYYPFVIASIASTLLLTTFLTSNYIHGYDIHLEYYISNVTKNISYWNRSLGLDVYYRSSLTLYTYNSMLSITVLPTVFSNILNMEQTWVFKIIYPLIFSFVPLGLYQLFQRQWGKKVAFLSVLFFMSNVVFFDFRGNFKQGIAELFYVLLFLVLLKKDMNHLTKWIILTCFGFALVVSHYTINYMFLFLIFSTWLCGKIFVKNKDKKINSLIVVFFFTLTFLWYSYIVIGPFDRLLLVFKQTFQNLLEEFFYPQSRGEAVLTAVGIVSSPSFLHNIGRILYDITVGFILIGFITLLAQRKKEGLDSEYFLLTSLTMGFQLMSVIIPNLSIFYYMGRMYRITLFFLSPLFILGGRTFFENMFKILPLKKARTHTLKRRESYSLILILTVLMAFFLFQTGFVYEITGDPVPPSISLSKYRMGDYTRLDLGLIDENDFFGATWLSKYVNVENTKIYSDTKARRQVLTSSMINRNDSITSLSNTTVFTSRSYIYLSQYNTMTGILIYDTRPTINIRYNVSEIYIFNSTMVLNNKIYSNGACEIHYYAP